MPADVIPLQAHGVIDTDNTVISAPTLTAQALLNLWESGKEGPYAVRHSQKPASDFPQHGGESGEESNFWEKTYPVLFPYGAGGPERQRETKLGLQEHIQWLLQQHDHRFRKHETFAFLVCSILQRRQSLLSARLQMKYRHFNQEAQILPALSLEALKQAEKEETDGLPISNPLVRLLKQRAFAITKSVMGSDASRLSMRGEIQATTMFFNPPTLWLTINPDDLHDPIAQVFCNEEIDMDSFDRLLGPNRQQRARNITEDCFAAAKFFNFLIRQLTETLMDISVTPRRVESGKGIFGRVRAYYGVVECQGRGTLHLHMMVWLYGSPTSEKMHQLLKQEDFRTKVCRFIHANIHAHHPSIPDAASIFAMKADAEIGYSRPPYPGSPTYWDDVKDLELQVMRAKQMHTCGAGCQKVDRYGKVYCKRRAPWPLSHYDVVMESGKWEPKRTYGYQNGSCPAVTNNFRCNNDLKLMLHGPDTEGAGWYIGNYQAKKQGKSHNVSALMQRATSYHRSNDPYANDLMESHRLFLFRCANILNNQQELPLTMCMSYLMGWGDVYRSHNYIPLYWTSFHRTLVQQFPALTKAPGIERLVEIIRMRK